MEREQPDDGSTSGAPQLYSPCHGHHAGENIPQVATITLHLYNAEVFRGAAPNNPIDLPPIPRKIDELHIILPRFSESGGYTVAVLRSRDNGSAVAIASGDAIGNRKKMEITVRLDLRNVSPGEYWLGTRHDADQVVRYYPLKIEQQHR